MVPKIAKKGKSFKGAGLYYLHDKKALTARRVAFTLTHNLPTDNAELALRFMAYTAMRQAELKAASGAARTGRKLQQAVYTYSLSWAPDERPDQDAMIEAAQETLKVLEIEAHEALFVAHNDEPHQHIHIIVNRVHPETGLAAKLSNDRLKLSKWAEDYERAHGKIYCEQRVENNAMRQGGAFVKDRESFDKASFHRARKDSLKAVFDRQQIEAASLYSCHADQRRDLYEMKERRIERLRRDIRKACRPQWAQLYRRQEEERNELHLAEEAILSRLRYWLKHRDRRDRGILAGAIKALFTLAPFRHHLEACHKAGRKALACEITQRIREAIGEENRHYRHELKELARLSLKADHGSQSEALARGIAEDEARWEQEEKERRSRESQKDSPPEISEEFRKCASKRVRKPRKRDGRGKRHRHQQDKE